MNDENFYDVPTVRRFTPAPFETTEAVPATLRSPVIEPVPTARRFYPLEAAASRLHIPLEALRKRLRRAANRTGLESFADLGGGVIGIKVGPTWRVLIPDFGG